MLLSIAEIIQKTVELKTEEEKIAFLQKNRSFALMAILRITYDKSVELNIPDTAPPWKKNGLIDVHGRLYQEAKRFKIFIKGGPYDGKLKKLKVEQLFIEILEGIDDKDAEIVSNMIQRKPLMGIPLFIIEKAFPDIYQLKLF